MIHTLLAFGLLFLFYFFIDDVGMVLGSFILYAAFARALRRTQLAAPAADGLHPYRRALRLFRPHRRRARSFGHSAILPLKTGAPRSGTVYCHKGSIAPR